MCKICVDFESGKINSQEALQNLREVWNEGDDHLVDLWIEIMKRGNSNPPEDTF